MNIFRAIKAETVGFIEKTAVVDGNERVSYGRLISASEGTTAALGMFGVSSHDRVALLCGNSLDYITLSLAVLAAGAVIVPISPENSADEIREILEELDVEFLIFRHGYYEAEVAPRLVSDGLVEDFYIMRRGHGSALPDEYHNMEPAFIRFTSGTTGSSKGVVLSHRTIMERTDAADRGLCITSMDKVLWVLSMSYHFVVSILLFLRRGASIILCGNPVEQTLPEGLSKESGTVIYAAPFHYEMLLRSGLAGPEPFKNLRLAVSTTMGLPERTANEFKEKFGVGIAEAYGIIEVGLPFIGTTDTSGTGGRSLGRPLPDYEARIDEPDQKDGVGEVMIRGRGMLDAYFSPWRVRDDILEDGWFRTGDLGVIDDEGNLVLAGRRNSVINFAGMKIFPYEVESVINQYPGIAESCVCGERHDSYGQLPVAKIVSIEGGSDKLDLSGLRKFCYMRLASYKVPKMFEIVSGIAKTKSGKIKRH